MTNKFIVALMAAAFLSGCGGGNDTPAASVDTSNPMQVAEAFYAAVDEQDLAAALQYVDPEMAADFREAMSSGMPNLPSDYEVIVMAQEDHAEASITGADLEVDMILVDGSWWITR
jgi:limonene-1,2-epoxide hydrolase